MLERYRKILSAYIVELGHIGPPSRFGPAVTLGVSKKFGDPWQLGFRSRKLQHGGLEKSGFQQFQTVC